MSAKPLIVGDSLAGGAGSVLASKLDAARASSGKPAAENGDAPKSEDKTPHSSQQ